MLELSEADTMVNTPDPPTGGPMPDLKVARSVTDEGTLRASRHCRDRGPEDHPALPSVTDDRL